MALMSIGIQASLRGTVIKPTNKNIQYVGRICFDNPERPRFTFPGTQINARFTGTSLKLWAKSQSGYFMAQIDEAEPFKVAFMGQRDSVVTLATALSQGEHTIRLMYVIVCCSLHQPCQNVPLSLLATALPAAMATKP